MPLTAGGRSTVAEASEYLAEAVTEHDDRLAYRIVLQVAVDLATAPPSTRSLLPAEAPRRTGPGWDAFVAAVTEWRLAEAGLPAPGWALEREGDPTNPWSSPIAILPARPDHVAEPFQRRGVLVDVDGLASA